VVDSKRYIHRTETRMERNTSSSFVLGIFIFLGLGLLGYFLSNGVVRLRAMERQVVAKGLSEREVPADIAIWPIRFSVADNSLVNLYSTIQSKSGIVKEFLKTRGFEESEISVAPPVVYDRETSSTERGDPVFRYSGSCTVTVYTQRVDAVVKTMSELTELGKMDIAITGGDYSTQPSFLFTKLNDIKPEMIEEATKKAREVAIKFAEDSDSKVGNIRTANQGSFEIEDRDENTPHIKRVRIVSTITYYLVD